MRRSPDIESSRNRLLNRISPFLIFCFLLSGVAVRSHAQANPATPAAQPKGLPEPNNPQLKHRPPVRPEAEAVKGRIHLDVSVTDASGDPVTSLGLSDFTVLDNGQPQKMVSLQFVDGPDEKPESETRILLIVDTVNSRFQDMELSLSGVEKFLRQRKGRLAAPVTVAFFTEAGFQMVSQSTTDGNALADIVHRVRPSVHTIHSSAGQQADAERFLLSVKSLTTIVNKEIREPGRKVLVWTGPGWPIFGGSDAEYSERGHRINFNVLASLTNGLREARMVVCSAGGGPEYSVHDYLKPVKSPYDANAGRLALQVIAVHSGGQTLDPGNGSSPEEQIRGCVRGADSYYSLEFDPPKAKAIGEYHGLKVKVDRPGLTAHTNDAYYGEP